MSSPGRLARHRARSVAAAMLGCLCLIAVPGFARAQVPQALETAPEPVRLTDDPAQDRAPAWSPVAGALVFASDRDGDWDLYLIDPHMKETVQLTENPGTDRSPAWSPDGRRIVFYSEREEGAGLYVLDIFQRSISKLVEVEGADPHPDWSPDGGWIAYDDPVEGTLQLFVVSVVDGTARQVTSGPQRSVWPRWSPDGTRLAFFSRRDTDGEDDEIYVLDLNTGEWERITDRPGHDFCPEWSRDGTRLVVASITDSGNRYLGIVDLTGRELVRLAPGFTRVTEPSWSADGRVIAFAARAGDDAYDLWEVSVPD